MTTFAALFDIDGTLVDSNFLHVEAWAHAFHDLQLDVPAWKIQRAVGADSHELLGMLMESESDEVRARAQSINAQHFKALQSRVEVFAGARELVADLASRGCHVVLATSAPGEELTGLLEELDIDEHVFAVTSAEDVEKAKPEPEIISLAVARGKADPSNAVMVGDSVWDMKAAVRAGVAAIGVLSGGTGRDDLLRAGASAVYDDVADLHAHLDQEPAFRFSAVPSAT